MKSRTHRLLRNTFAALTISAMATAATIASWLMLASAVDGAPPGAGPGYGMGAGPGAGMGHGYGQGYGMDPGYGRGYGHGYGMGPGMGRGYGQGYGGQGHGMGQGYGNYGHGCDGPGGTVLNAGLDTEAAKAMIERQLAMRGNPRVKVGEVKEVDDDTITVDIVTKAEGALVDQLTIDRHTGRMLRRR